MTVPISRFSLETHSGLYESWPVESRLLLDGESTRATVHGHSLLHQFETDDGYFLVTDMDCPFEETTHFTLLSQSLRVLSSRFLGWPYQSWLLSGFRVVDAHNFEATFGENEKWSISIRDWGIPYVYPRIGMQRVRL